MFAIEDHRLCIAALALLTIDVKPHIEVLRILDFVLGDEPRTDRPKGFAALALVPLAAAAFDLENALGHIVAKEIAGNGVLRLVACEISCTFADDDSELDLPVELARLARDDGVIVRPADADRLFRNGHAGFRRVV